MFERKGEASDVAAIAAGSSSASLQALLQDERIDPMVELNEVILAVLDRRPDGYPAKKATRDRKLNRDSKWVESLSVGIDNLMKGDAEKSLLVLTRDVRVDLSLLSQDFYERRSAVRILSYGLSRKIKPRLEGILTATKSTNVQAVAQILEGEDDGILSRTLQAILLLDLDTVGLLDWMIRMQDEQLQHAATAILQLQLPTDNETAIVRGLLLMLLYPKLSLRDNVAALKEEGMSIEDVQMCAQLIGAVLASDMGQRMN